MLSCRDFGHYQILSCRINDEHFSLFEHDEYFFNYRFGQIYVHIHKAIDGPDKEKLQDAKNGSAYEQIHSSDRSENNNGNTEGHPTDIKKEKC